MRILTRLTKMTTSHNGIKHMFFDYSDEVKHALDHKQPVLALESTVITHGLPYPINLETAFELEQMAYDCQVTPATIAILNGRIKIGLKKDELVQLAETPGILKATTRDLPYLLAQGLSAGTTVAATAYCAHAVGIKIFATGGIGGVHRGDSMDISADLLELTKTPVTVVCAGAKAILDLPKTLEFLETYHIPVIGYQTPVLPAFYTRETPYKLTARADDVVTLTKILQVQNQLHLKTGTLIVNPVPAKDEIPASFIEPIIIQAIRKANENQITGKELTPFLLSELARETDGKSMQANLALIKNNVKLGAELSYTLASSNDFKN